MTHELVKCPCCDKMVPAYDMELSYRLPDAIASMDTDEIKKKCQSSKDYVVCEDEYYYLRCILPLPVQDTGKDYSIGVWAQVSEKSFIRIWELWEDPDQVNELPFNGLLANSVHLNTHVEDIEIEVTLTGVKSRPSVKIKDAESSLYKEQQNGITVHRASEYTDLYR